ncbi:hypothetical protein Ancab_005131, partial [Ancistrocladus abbreviatus]
NNRRGRKFGFVRFLDVMDIEELLQQLRQIWVGSFKLRVDTARKVSSGSGSGRSRDASPTSMKEPSRSTRAVRGGRSYMEVVVNYKPNEVDKLMVGKEASKNRYNRIL